MLSACAAPPLPPAAVRVNDAVYVLRGEGVDADARNRGRTAHAAFVVGPRGVIVVDTGVSYRHGEAIMAAVARVTERPIVAALITHPAQEYLFGAAAFQARGIPVLMHRRAAALAAQRCGECLRRLTQRLGASEMAGTRVPTPDRLLDGDTELDAGGLSLRVLAAEHASAPGALAVFEPVSATLIVGDLAFVGRVPDLRDADVAGWLAMLDRLRATGCVHLIPGRGAFGRCTDLEAQARYLTALDARAQRLAREGVSLLQVPALADLPEFAHWDGYAALHPANAARLFLWHERRLLPP
ncbi:MAG: MBL fold metallo-hydrolase [Burkholderiaceae bacterium]|nr:MBL fold metallo-hydrolase [Burkholderiaceae bacterium]